MDIDAPLTCIAASCPHPGEPGHQCPFLGLKNVTYNSICTTALYDYESYNGTIIFVIEARSL